MDKSASRGPSPVPASPRLATGLIQPLGGTLTWKDRQYFHRRAAVERALAEAAGDIRVASIHLELADRYEVLMREGKRSTLRIVTDRVSEAA